MRRIGVIDLGTNTFNLLIADVNHEQFTPVYSEKDGVALGMGGINSGTIAADAFLRGIDTIAKFKRICDTYQVDEIRAIGTSALRDAKNQAEFLDTVLKNSGIKVEIISGDQEAELIYYGVHWSYQFEEATIIMDIGGGSTEFIIADRSGILDKQSFDIGVSRIFQELSLNDPYTEEDVRIIERWLDQKTNSFFEDKSCHILIGASGSFETFHEMIHSEKFEEHIDAKEFDPEELVRILNWMVYSTQAERDEHPYIIPIRRKMAPIAAVKTLWVIKKLGINRFFVTPCSLKEGVLKKYSF